MIGQALNSRPTNDSFLPDMAITSKKSLSGHRKWVEGRAKSFRPWKGDQPASKEPRKRQGRKVSAAKGKRGRLSPGGRQAATGNGNESGGK